MRADALARATSDALGLIHTRLASRVLLHLAGAAAASHAEVLHAAAKTRLLVTLEMRKRDHDIGVHQGVADLGLLHVLPVFHRDERLVGALEAIGDDDLAAGGIGREPILVRAIDVLERVLAAANVQRIAVGEEGHAAELLHHIGNGACIVGTQEGEVPQLTKVNLDGDKLVLEVDLLNAEHGE